MRIAQLDLPDGALPCLHLHATIGVQPVVHNYHNQRRLYEPHVAQ